MKDAVQANIVAAQSNATGVFNIGTGNNITLNRLAEAIIRIFGVDLQPIYQAPRAGDVRDSLAGIAKARAIGYKPQWNLEDGISETIQRFENAN